MADYFQLKEASASELLENPEEMFPPYLIYINMFRNYSVTH